MLFHTRFTHLFKHDCVVISHYLSVLALNDTSNCSISAHEDAYRWEPNFVSTRATYSIEVLKFYHLIHISYGWTGSFHLRIYIINIVKSFWNCRIVSLSNLLPLRPSTALSNICSESILNEQTTYISPLVSWMPANCIGNALKPVPF